MTNLNTYHHNEERLIELRRKLHQFPELSGQESQTLEILKEFFSGLKTTNFHENIGGNSIAWEFSPENPEKTVIFRADTDALPIEDEISQSYASKKPGLGHKCGHDGHMAILTGLALSINEKPPEKTRVILLFQAEEETGRGAEKVVNHQWFKKLKPDYVFGLHNLPGFPQGAVILKENIFASSSTGMIIKLKGKSAHAGQPEDGINPASAVARLIEFVNQEIDYNNFRKFCLVTIIHFRLGEVAFGTSPGEADFMLTIRAADERDLDEIIELISNRTEEICNVEKLGFSIGFTERFPSTVNHAEGITLVKKAIDRAAPDTVHIAEAFRWSEDFGHYLKSAKGAFFGLGSGENIPRLHNPDYDFPDEIIMPGIKMFKNIYLQLEE